MANDIIEAIKAGNTELWLHPNQKISPVAGRVIYSYLQGNDLLTKCANTSELEVIQANGVNFFWRYFVDVENVFAWGDVQDGCVSYLCVFGGKVVLLRASLSSGLFLRDPALRRK